MLADRSSLYANWNGKNPDWPEVKDPKTMPKCLQAFLFHSDCDGGLSWEVCGQLYEYLDQALKRSPEEIKALKKEKAAAKAKAKEEKEAAAAAAKEKESETKKPIEGAEAKEPPQKRQKLSPAMETRSAMHRVMEMMESSSSFLQYGPSRLRGPDPYSPYRYGHRGDHANWEQLLDGLEYCRDNKVPVVFT